MTRPPCSLRPGPRPPGRAGSDLPAGAAAQHGRCGGWPRQYARSGFRKNPGRRMLACRPDVWSSRLISAPRSESCLGRQAIPSQRRSRRNGGSRVVFVLNYHNLYSATSDATRDHYVASRTMRKPKSVCVFGIVWYSLQNWSKSIMQMFTA